MSLITHNIGAERPEISEVAICIKIGFPVDPDALVVAPRKNIVDTETEGVKLAWDASPAL